MTRSLRSAPRAWLLPAALLPALLGGAQEGEASEIVLHASAASARAGSWQIVSDASAAGGQAMWQPDAGAPKVTAAAASPAHYFELTFMADAGVGYRLWIRGRAERDHWSNDSVFVQFSGAVTASGTAQWRIGTTSATEVNLEDCSGCGLAGWGWQDNGWGVDVLGPLVYFASTGAQTVRIQTREDGLRIDQIVLSSALYLNRSPGALKNDATILLASPGGVPPPPSPAATLVRGPYLQQVSSGSAIVVWATREAGPADVRYATVGGKAMTAAATSRLRTAAQTGMAADYYQHEARLTGLAATTAYDYTPRAAGAAVAPPSRFTTAPAPGQGSVTFVAFGDSGTGSADQQRVARALEGERFDFALHTGDIVYGNTGGTGAATHSTYHNWFFEMYRAWLGTRPMFPSMGNHDSRSSNDHGRAYRDLFVLPEHGATQAYPDHAERYYSFDYGPMHVVVLDSERAFEQGGRRDAQLAWLEADLAGTKQPWKIAVFHRSPYSSSTHHGSDLAIRAAFTPVFERHGVQLVLTAHDHLYERSRPIRAGFVADDGVVYVVSGGGGAPLYPAGTSGWSAFTASRYHYVRGTADPCQLRLEAVDSRSVVFDFVTLERCAPAPTPPLPGGPQDVVLYASEAPVVRGQWRRESSTTAAGGALMRHPDAGAPKLNGPLAQPADYFEMTFVAEAGVPYRLWMRGRAQSNSWANDSVFVQFSNSVNASGGAVWRIGTTSATEYNLEDCSGCGLAGWGWQDNGWGVGVLGPEIRFATSGTQTIRVQTREDGLSIDQIVLSPSRYLTTAPGALKNDTTVLPR